MPHRPCSVRPPGIIRLGTLPHPPCSPDMSPRDYYLFPLVKDSLCERRLGDLQELSTVAAEGVRDINKHGLARGLVNFQSAWSLWLHAMETAVKGSGEFLCDWAHYWFLFREGSERLKLPLYIHLWGLWFMDIQTSGSNGELCPPCPCHPNPLSSF